MDIFSKISTIISDAAKEVREESESYSFASLKNEHSLFSKEDIASSSPSKRKKSNESENHLSIEKYIPKYKKMDFSEKKKHLKKIAKTHQAVAHKHANTNVGKQLHLNSSDLLKEITSFELYYFEMNESERVDAEQNIIFILNNTNELTAGELINLPREFLEFVSLSEENEILQPQPETQSQSQSQNNLSFQMQPNYKK